MLVLVIALVGVIALPVLQVVFYHVRPLSARMECSENLAAVRRAMLSYAQDYDGRFPVAGGPRTQWGAGLRKWTAANRAEAFGLDPNGAGGAATISSSLYLLIRHAYAGPGTFLCPRDKGVREFRPMTYGLSGKSLKDLWDFGPDPTQHCSYAYQMIYSPLVAKLRISSEPMFALAADRNPWISGKGAEDFSRFMPDIPPYSGHPEQARYGNSRVHGRDGQNVLFLDMHVNFEQRAYCSIEDDNIYTSREGEDRVRGKPPTLGSQPANEKDSLLVNDSAAPGK